ncbi:MAG: DNA-3-methyladenine glycosylase [Candidatus Microsaccharimonas sp.]
MVRAYLTQQARSVEGSFPDFLNDPVDVVAKKLLGCELEREIDKQIIKVRIIETESYDEDDEASHAFGGERIRNSTMFKEAGHLYVYFIYGIHYCCNVVTGPAGYGSGVLIRAVEPVIGKELIENRRGVVGYNATNGPGKTCSALGIDLRMNGHNLRTSPIRLITGSLRPDETIISSRRIGISKARDVHRRFFIEGNPYVSRQTRQT